MLIEKITNGYVKQVFDTATQTWISREFVEGDENPTFFNDGLEINQTDFENRVIGVTPYLPFEMKQPE